MPRVIATLLATILVMVFVVAQPADARKKRSGSGHHRAAHSRIVHVKGYTRRSTGKYVYGHRRTGADRTKVNNFSARGNVNPFTGKKGTKKVDR